MAYALGLDSSTQSLTGTIIDTTNQSILASHSVNFGIELPQYKAQNGYRTTEEQEFLASPLMWLDALELLFTKLKQQNGIDISNIKSIAGTAQQHATVYVNEQFPSTLANLTSSSSLAEQLSPTLSRALSPIWMDQTTTKECSEISFSVGAKHLHSSTGSIATARFSGPQIRKFANTQPEAYAATATIHMASSFLASVLSGTSAPLDRTDSSGMNLLDLSSGEWSPSALEATAEGLFDKLPNLTDSTDQIGTISPYFVEKYGFATETSIIAWTGDNPASLVGMGGTAEPRLIISLGTSYTVFASMTKPNIDPHGYGHVFGNPLGGFMALNCFTNGALTNDTLCKTYGLNWEQFNEYASQPPSSLDSEFNPFVIPEITPPTPANNDLQQDSNNAPEVIRKVLDNTFLNLKAQSSWIPLPEKTIFITGGASQSTGICQTIANVFNREVKLLESPDSAALGAAMLASHAAGLNDIESLAKAFVKTSDTSYIPQPEIAALYES